MKINRLIIENHVASIGQSGDVWGESTESDCLEIRHFIDKLNKWIFAVLGALLSINFPA